MEQQQQNAKPICSFTNFLSSHHLPHHRYPDQTEPAGDYMQTRTEQWKGFSYPQQQDKLKQLKILAGAVLE